MTRPTAANWHAERYAAGEQCATAMRHAIDLLDMGLMASRRENRVRCELENALAEYERTRDHP